MAVSGATFTAPIGNVPSGFLGALLAGFLRKVTEESLQIQENII